MITSVIDLLSRYDQLPLDSRDFDITAISTPIGLLRATRALQGATNSVAQFCHGMEIVLGQLIPSSCRVFLDDIGMKGPKNEQPEKSHPELPGIRQFVFDHLRNPESVLFFLEVAGITISGEKSQSGAPGVKVVGWACDERGRRAGAEAVAKIMDWPVPTGPREI